MLRRAEIEGEYGRGRGKGEEREGVDREGEKRYYIIICKSTVNLCNVSLPILYFNLN